MLKPIFACKLHSNKAHYSKYNSPQPIIIHNPFQSQAKLLKQKQRNKQPQHRKGNCPHHNCKINLAKLFAQPKIRQMYIKLVMHPKIKTKLVYKYSLQCQKGIKHQKNKGFLKFLIILT